MTHRTAHTAIIKQAFKGLDRKAVDMLRRVAVSQTYPSGTVLCHEGGLADKFYVVTAGRVVITRDLEDTDEDFVLGFMGPGQFFGEMGLITEERRAATVTTLVDTEVLEVSKEDFDRVFSASPAMARSILNTLIGIVRETDKRAIEDLEKRNRALAQAYAELEAAQADRVARAALEAQLEVAALAQRSLLPTELPRVAGFEFAASFEPARQVGGDFYDLRVLDGDRVAVLLADVSDKGAHAALFMAVARTLFLTEERYQIDPKAVVEMVHRGLVESSSYEMFVTAVYGVLDPHSGVFRYVRAGHDEPLHVRADGTVGYLGGEGRFLGLWPEFAVPFEEQRVTLQPGDFLVFFSDGVTDMRNPEGQPFGSDRLARLVTSLRRFDAEGIARSIYDAVQEHRAGVEAFDDFTLLVVRAALPDQDGP